MRTRAIFDARVFSHIKHGRKIIVKKRRVAREKIVYNKKYVTLKTQSVNFAVGIGFLSNEG